MKMRNCIAAIVLLLFVLVVSCAKSVKVQRTAPAKYDVTQVKSIVLVPVKSLGSKGASHIDDIVLQVESLVESRSFFDDVKVYSEDLPDTPTEDQLIEIIKKEKAHAVLTVEVRNIDVDTSFDTRLERKIGDEDALFRQKCYRSYGIRHERWDENRLYCKIPIVRKRASAKAVVVYLKRQGGGGAQNDITITENYDAEGVYEVERVESDREIIEDLSSRITREVADTVTPHPVKYKAKLSTQKGCNKGNQLAKDGRWHEAIAAWEELIHKDPQKDGAYYNIGVAYEGLGKYEMARHFYNRAALTNPNPKYIEALNRIEMILEEQEKLRKQMR